MRSLANELVTGFGIEKTLSIFKIANIAKPFKSMCLDKSSRDLYRIYKIYNTVWQKV